MAATVSPNAIVLEVLNQDNYKEWSFRVETYLLAEGLWDVVESTSKPPRLGGDNIGEAEVQEWRKKNAKALHAIQICCGTEMFSVISGIREAKVAWDALKVSFMPGLILINFADKGSPDHTANEHDGEELVRSMPIEATRETCMYNSFKDNVKSGKWDAAKAILTQNGDSVRAENPFYVTQALLPEIKMGNVPLHIIKELVELMTEQDLEIIDDFGATPFGYAVHAGLTQIVECMAKKNKKLPTMRFPPAGWLPVLVAYNFRQWEMARYLYDVTPLELLISGRDGAELISQSLAFTKEYGIARDLIQRCPHLAVTRDYFGHSPLNALACMRSAFLTGVRLNFWQQWIYDHCVLPPFKNHAISIDILEDNNGNQRNRICSVTGLQQRLVMNLLKLLGMNHIYEMKLMHARTLEFLKCMCKVAKEGNYNELQLNFMKSAIFQAVERGHVEFVIQMCKVNPGVLWIMDGKGRNMFHHAIDCRQEKIYNLIYLIDKDVRTKFAMSGDKFNNTLLHAAGNLSTQLSQIHGAPLQMQRELQWFKEVENILPSGGFEVRSFYTRMTARELFTKNHKELVKEGEKSIKETATSCTVVGALIVTIMFAAAFTFPGGNNGTTGVPIFLNKKLFLAFIISDAISLFSSLTSVIIFLGLLTSRYSEDDFLMSLPTKIILGLLFLFISITTMMIAFSSGLLMMLQAKYLNIVIPLISIAIFPIISFASMHFSLFYETFDSTFGKGLFDKKPKRRWDEIISE